MLASTNTGAEGRPMPKNIKHGKPDMLPTPRPCRAYFAEQKDRMGLSIRTVGWSRRRQGQIRDMQFRHRF
ncbi:hypothetical protein X743_11080 [Mesorhizobium sp. LNHC252B00]|nr:hypothetical protein X743_11080 [Mesorhizobium sp. LNHC252B00]